MHCEASAEDRAFLQRFERAALAPQEFSHAAHVRVAYAYLCEHAPGEAQVRMRLALQHFLAHHGIDAAKYHETLTRAWVLAVHHFMARAGACASAEVFISRSARLFEPGIMLTHYREATLFSDAARAQFVAPDLAPIPLHA